MGNRYRLTPMKDSSGQVTRWRKKDKRILAGFVYFPRLKGETVEQSERRAWSEWKDLEADLIKAAKPSHRLVVTQRVDYPPNYIPENAVEYTDNQGRTVKAPLAATIFETTYEGIEDPATFVESLPHVTPSETQPPTLRKELDNQHAHKKSLAENGQRAIKTALRFKEKAEHFLSLVGPDIRIDRVTSADLLKLHTKLANDINEGKRTSGGAKSIMQATIHFLTTAYSVSETLPALPKILHKKPCPLMQFVAGSKQNNRREEANFFDDLPTLALITKSSPERLRLFLYLMLNCGFQQTDISELQHSDIDWTNGTIPNYVRQKNRHRDNPTKTTYTLWPETFALLKKYAAPSGRLFLNERGGTLIKENSQTDNIDNAYRQRLLKEKLELPKDKQRPLAAMRKTSSTLLEHSRTLTSHKKDYSAAAQHFLGQTDGSVKAKHYTPANAKLLTQALAWLGEYYRKHNVLKGSDNA